MGLLAFFGFAASGVIKGSTAAWIQSTVYGGATTGLFSIAQSWGALGLAAGGSSLAAIKCLM